MAELPVNPQFHPGLVSITFRQLAPQEIVTLVRQAGLLGIEWGGDVHVPHSDFVQARQVKQMTLDAGLQVAAYGSYYRVVPPEPVAFEIVLETALMLGAPLIRIWAGKLASQDADGTHRDALISEASRIAGLAASAGVRLAFEYHGGTLTDTDASAQELLSRIDHPNLGSYWQPRPAATVEENLLSLAGILPWLSHLHVFDWQMTSTGAYKRLPLREGQPAWQRFLKQAASTPGERYAMLEFVRDDSATAFLQDAATLIELCQNHPTIQE